MAIGKTVLGTPERSAALLRRGRVLGGVTLGWNVAGIVVLPVAAVAARSVALAGFGLDSLIEIGPGRAGAERGGGLVVGGPAGRPGHRVLRAAGGAGDLPGRSLTVAAPRWRVSRVAGLVQ